MKKVEGGSSKKAYVLIGFLIIMGLLILFRRYVPYYSRAMELVGLDTVLPTDVDLVMAVQNNPQLSLTTLGASTTALGALARLVLQKKREVEETAKTLTSQVNEAKKKITDIGGEFQQNLRQWKIEQEAYQKEIQQLGEEKGKLGGQISALINKHKLESSEAVREKDKWLTNFLNLQRETQSQATETALLQDNMRKSISDLENSKIASVADLSEKNRKAESTIEVLTNQNKTNAIRLQELNSIENKYREATKTVTDQQNKFVPALTSLKEKYSTSLTSLKAYQTSQLATLKDELKLLEAETNNHDLTGEQLIEVIKKKEATEAKMADLEFSLKESEKQLEATNDLEV